MLRRLTSCCLFTIHRACGYGRPWVCSGRHLGVAGARCYLSSSTSGGGGGEVVYVPGYEKVKELQQADMNVQKMLSLNYASQREHNKVATANMIQQLQEREGDTGSSLVQIGTLTVRIWYLTEHMKKNRKDKSCVRSLIQLVHRRRKLLLMLKETDSDKYQTILRDLGLREPTVQKYLQKHRKKK